MILPILALAFGSVGGFALGRGISILREDKREQQKALPPARSQVPTPMPQDAYRSPDPTAVINAPIDAEDFRQMAEAFCVCHRELSREHGRAPTVDELRDCFLGAIYPDFQWPPVPGDPASAQLMWLVADHEARKVIADPTACGGGA